MIFRSPIIATCALAFFFLAQFARSESTDESIARATAAIAAATPRAQADPARPIFHVMSPAQWINDPNGPIFYKGVYHLFYQLHPFSDGSGPKYWGHVRSSDLVSWETLPIALCPAKDAGEAEVWSGCCTINGLGQPMIFYTSIAPNTSAQDHAEQWAALGDDDLLQWHRSPANPVLSEALHEGKKIYDWRDPFIFQDKGRTFLVAGGNLNRAQGSQATVNIYEAQNKDLTRWKYQGVLFQDSDPRAKTVECPNFFKLGKQWVLFFSPYGKVQYFVGDFDATICRFHPRTRGVLDHGPNFYAPNTMQVPDGRRLMWGWVPGFAEGQGWNGCLTLPRQLSLSRDGQLHQSPAPQLTKLRGQLLAWRDVHLENGGKTLPLPKTNTLEILAEIDLRAATNFEITIENPSGGAAPIAINLSNSQLRVMDAKAPLIFASVGRKLKLDIFLDRSVLEVFANDTICLTKVISPLKDAPTLHIQSDGNATAKKIQAWPMKTIWK